MLRNCPETSGKNPVPENTLIGNLEENWSMRDQSARNIFILPLATTTFIFLRITEQVNKKTI